MDAGLEEGERRWTIMSLWNVNRFLIVALRRLTKTNTTARRASRRSPPMIPPTIAGRFRLFLRALGGLGLHNIAQVNIEKTTEKKVHTLLVLVGKEMMFCGSSSVRI